MKVVKSQENRLRSIIIDPEVTVKRFFFPLDIATSDRLELIPHSSTGDFCFRTSVDLGYKQIFFIGIDLEYKQLKEATPMTREEIATIRLPRDYYKSRIYKIRRTVKDNPNYFFADYQDLGDIFSEPRGNSWHLLSWYQARELAESKKLTVRNLGNSSGPIRDFFHRLSLLAAFDAATQPGATFPTIKTSSVASVVFQGEKAIGDRIEGELDSCRTKLTANDVSLEALSAQIAFDVRLGVSDPLKVSVIVSCFNSAPHISFCLESLARQTMPAEQFEVLCVDDYSTDRTVEVILSFQQRIPKLRLIRHQEKKKQGAARNSGLQHARGQYVTFVDADDFLRLDALEILFNTAKGVELIVAQLSTFRYDKPICDGVINRFIRKTLEQAGLDNSLGWWPVGMLISRNLIERNTIQFREDVYYDNIYFIVRLFFAARNCVVSKERIYYNVERDNSFMMSMSEKKLADSAAAIAVVRELIRNEGEQEVGVFKSTAISWLAQQTTRMIDSNATSVEIETLKDSFIKELDSRSLFQFLGEPLRSQIRNAGARKPTVVPTGSESLGASESSYRYLPWGNAYEEIFSGKVIFFREVDYHIRSVAPVVRELTGHGVCSIIIDASRSTNFSSSRPLGEDEEKLYSDIEILKVNVAQSLPFATSASAFVFMNDLTYTKQLIY